MWRDREGTGTGLRDFTCRLHSLQIESGVLRCCSQIRERASATRFTDTPQPSVSRLCGREPKKRRGRAEGEPRKSRGNLAARHQRRRRESGPCANRRGRGFAEVFAKGFRQGRGRAATFNSQAPRHAPRGFCFGEHSSAETPRSGDTRGDDRCAAATRLCYSRSLSWRQGQSATSALVPRRPLWACQSECPVELLCFGFLERVTRSSFFEPVRKTVPSRCDPPATLSLVQKGGGN